jgi:hypothetical protein
MSVLRAWRDRKNSITVGIHLCVVFVILAAVTLFFAWFVFVVCFIFFIRGILKRYICKNGQ